MPSLELEIQSALEEIHAKHKDNQSGKVADYIPELAKADPNAFGICVVTRDGQVFEVGDTDQQFTIQSVSKPFVYGMALQDTGRARRGATEGGCGAHRPRLQFHH